MDILGELQKRGFQVVQCPGRVEIATNMVMRLKAKEDGVTVRDQVNEAICDIIHEVSMSAFQDVVDELVEKREAKSQA